MGLALARHLGAIALALGAMAVLVEFLVVGWPIAAYLPLLGTIIVSLNVLLCAEAVLALGFGNETLQQVVRILDRAARLGLFALAACAAFVASNATLDRSPRTIRRARVADIGWRTVSAGVPIVYSWMHVVYGVDRGGLHATFALGPKDQRTFWRDEAIILGFRQGRFGVAWIDEKVRDDEVYFTRVLQGSPDARQPWKALIQFLLVNRAPEKALIQSRRYAERHPSDGGFAYWAGENMALQGYEAEAVALLTRAVALEPARYTSFRLAWVLTRMGESARAIDVIDESVLQYPDAWEFPFLKAYNLLKTAQYDGAVESLERVERLRPGVPGVQDTLERLRARERAVP
jgi:tetratricopeptide (TPR) repeat protein